MRPQPGWRRLGFLALLLTGMGCLYAEQAAGLPTSDEDRAAILRDGGPPPLIAVIGAVPLVDDFAQDRSGMYQGSKQDLEAFSIIDGALQPAHTGWRQRQYTRKELFLRPGTCVSIEVFLPPQAWFALGVGNHQFRLQRRGFCTLADPTGCEWDLYGMDMAGCTHLLIAREDGARAKHFTWRVAGGGIEGHGSVVLEDAPAQPPVALIMQLSKHDGTKDTRIRNLRHGPVPPLPPPRMATPPFIPTEQKRNDLPGDLDQAEKALVVDAAARSVTPAEIAGCLAFAAAAPFSANNLGNSYTLGSSGQAADAVDAWYGITGQRPFLDRLVQFSLCALAGRNDPQTGVVIAPGRRHLVWPHYGKIRLAGTQREVVTEISEALPRFIPRCARRILDHPEMAACTDQTGTTYREIARRLVRESLRSLDDFALPYFLDRTTGLFRYPDRDPDPRRFLDAPQLAGRTPPWNRQWMLCSGILDLALCLRKLDDDPQHLATCERIITATIAQFLATARPVEAQGQPCLVWDYILSPAGDRRCEDRNHGAVDLDFLARVHQAGGFGLTDEHMRRLANTIWFLMHKGNGDFSARVDGGGKVEPFTSRDLAPYLFYARWQPGIYEVLSRNITGRRPLNPLTVAALLEHKHWMQSRH